MDPDQLPKMEFVVDRIGFEIETLTETIRGYLAPLGAPLSPAAENIVQGDADQSLMVDLEDGSVLLVPYVNLRKARFFSAEEPK